MNEQELKLIIRGDGSSADKTLKDLQDGISSTDKTMTKAGVGMVAAGAAMGGALLYVAKAAGDTQQTHIKLENTLKNMPKLANANIQAFDDQAEALSRMTAADSDAVTAAQAMLGTFNLTEQQILDMTPLVVDYARKFGLKMEQAAVAVGKTLDGQMGALKRQGVSIDEVMYKTDRFRAVSEALQNQVGGFAQDEMQSLTAQLEQLKNKLGDIAEVAGGPAAEMIGEYVAQVTPAINATIDWMTANPEATKSIIKLTASTSAFLVVGGTTLIVLGQMSRAILDTKNAYVALKLSMAAGSLGGVAAELQYVTMNMTTLSASTIAAGGAAGAASLGYVALAGALGYGLTTAILKATGAYEKLEDVGKRLAEDDAFRHSMLGADGKLFGIDVAGEASSVSIASDDLTESWREMGIELDENNVITEKGIAQLKAMNAAQDRVNGTTRTAIYLTEEQIKALDDLALAKAGVESADIRLERAELRKIDADQAYLDALEEYGEGSREAEESDLDRRQAALDLLAAQRGVIDAQNAWTEALSKAPRPENGIAKDWIKYYESIGNAAGAAAAKANAANDALVGGKAKSSTGGRNILAYGSGGVVDGPQLALVGEAGYKERVVSEDPIHKDRSLGLIAGALSALVGPAPSMGDMGSSIRIYQEFNGYTPSDAREIGTAASDGTFAAMKRAAIPGVN